MILVNRIFAKLKALILYFIVYYNFFLNLLIIWVSLIIIMYSGDTSPLSLYLHKFSFIEKSSFLTGIVFRLAQLSGEKTVAFMTLMLILAMIEIVFLTAIVQKKRWGIIGFTCSSVIWLPIQIKIIISFFSITKFSVFLINILVILFLLSLIKNGIYLRDNKKSYNSSKTRRSP